MGNKMEHPSVELSPEKVVVVTGGNTGIGYETAKSIAKMGARVYIACRSEDKAKAAIERMQQEHQSEIQKRSHTQASGQASSHQSTSDADETTKPLNVEYMKLDLASLQSTMDFIQQTKEKMQYLNVLVCNAGIGFVKQEYTEDNYESLFQVNYLSHLLVVVHLLPLLRAGAPDSRIVLLSSTLHLVGKLDLDNMQGRNSYSRVGAYACSKAYMVMAAHFLSRRLEETGVSTFAVDPGLVDTDIVNTYSDWKLMSFAARSLNKMGMSRTPKRGAATSVVACVHPSLRGKTAVFMKNCRPANSANFCRNVKKQEALWRYSLGCLGRYISDDVLTHAFPSAGPDQLAIPGETGTSEGSMTGEPGETEGRSGGAEMGENSTGGEASLVRRPGGEQPKMDPSPRPAVAPSQTASQEPTGANVGEQIPEDTLTDGGKEQPKGDFLPPVAAAVIPTDTAETSEGKPSE